MGFGNGTSDAKLKYVGDKVSGYSALFASAKTEVTDADKTRIIAAIKALGESDMSAVDVESVIRYFVVHNYVINYDSYTGNIVHNYYLFEDDGVMHMIPRDYNLAYGTFMSGDMTSMINDDIDNPLGIGHNGDRPMFEWILNNEEALEMYHEYYEEFLNTVDPVEIIEEAYELIRPYVEKDPTKFSTLEEFDAGVEMLKKFCDLRTQSIRSQLLGDNVRVDGSSLNASVIGTMGGMGGSGGGDEGGSGSGGEENNTDDNNNQNPDQGSGGSEGAPAETQPGETTPAAPGGGSEGSEGTGETVPVETQPGETMPAEGGSEGSEGTGETAPTEAVDPDMQVSPEGSEGSEGAPAETQPGETMPAEGGSEGSEGAESGVAAPSDPAASEPAANPEGGSEGSEGSEGGENADDAQPGQPNPQNPFEPQTGNNTNKTQNLDNQTLILISVTVLTFGLLIALVYKRW